MKTTLNFTIIFFFLVVFLLLISCDETQRTDDDDDYFPPPPNIILSINNHIPATLPADGISSFLLEIKAVNDDGEPWRGIDIYFTSTLGFFEFELGTTNNEGVAGIYYFSGCNSGYNSFTVAAPGAQLDFSMFLNEADCENEIDVNLLGSTGGINIH